MPDGQVQRSWGGQPSAGSLQYLEAQRLLLKLGNAVVAAETTKWADKAGKQLKQDLQEMARSLEQTCGPLVRWRDEPWFKRVLQSECNQRGAAAYFRKQQLLEPWQFVAQYSRMLRNCLGHEEFEDEQLLPSDNGLPLAFTAEDVGLIESWPFAPLPRIPAVVGPIRSRWLDAQGSTTTRIGGMAGRAAALKSGLRGSHVSGAFSAPLRLSCFILSSSHSGARGPQSTVMAHPAAAV